MNAPGPIPGITIRPTVLEDLEEILIHRRRMFYDMGHRDEAVLDAMVRSSRPAMERYLRELTYFGWFALTPDGRIAAGAGLLLMPLVSGPLHPDKIERAYFLNVYTYPEFRKRGLARALTQKAIDWCRENQFKILWLHASNEGRPIYESLGFKATNEMKLVIE